ncbi:iron chelate uptake ABC transporter family permease subunit [Phytoactinopolyspora mesophila]|uniref:Iron chelate uptake ABC transporter family permease subunit n=1 Tax=Phytoactinopolyspora mesophila TaxID=2650750 RepID=A0A7K3MAV8_9ACTN|nr:iron chelate uptake ABC transporter family permease subunit [Phytoactinopolyspora mesophila]
MEAMQRALLVTVVASVACAILSCWLVLIGWSLMGDAVSHAVVPGVVLAYVVGAPFAVGAFVFGCFAVWLIGTVRATSRVKEDAAIGVVFTTLFALGLVLISVTPSHVDFGHILFGNVLWVSDADIIQVVVLGVVTVAVLLLRNRDLTLYAFDPDHAHTIGISPRRMQIMLLGLLALTVVVALQAVGVILVVAMVITPGATAYLLTNRMERMLVIAPALAVTCAFTGLYVAYYADVSPGGAVVLSQGTLFFIIYLFAPQRGVVAAYRRRAGAIRRVSGPVE